MQQYYKLWNVTYSFQVPGDIAGERFIQKYLVIAQNSAGAQKKADELFEKEPYYQDLNLRKKEVKRNVPTIYSKTIPRPQLSSEDDRENFTIDAKIKRTQKGFTIDFVVKEE